jgi:hypothetical protein
MKSTNINFAFVILFFLLSNIIKASDKPMRNPIGNKIVSIESKKAQSLCSELAKRYHERKKSGYTKFENLIEAYEEISDSNDQNQVREFITFALEKDPNFFIKQDMVKKF